MSENSGLPKGSIGFLKEGAVIGPKGHRFLLVKKLANTPYGEHWKALDQSAQNTPPISLLTLSEAENLDEKGLDALKQQVKKNQSLKHKHIALTYGFFDDGRHPPFVTTEPLGVGTLETLIKKGKHKALSLLQLRGISMQLAAALDAAWTNQRQAHLHVQLSLAHLNRGEGLKFWGFGLTPILSGDTNLAITPSLRRDDLRTLGFIIYQLVNGPSDPSHLLKHTEDGVAAKQPESLTDEQWAQLLKGVSGDPNMPAKTATSWVQSIFKKESDASAHDMAMPEPTAEASPPETEQHPEKDATDETDKRTKKKTPNTSDIPSKAKPFLKYSATFTAGLTLGLAISWGLGWITPDTPQAEELVDQASSQNQSQNQAQNQSQTQSSSNKPVSLSKLSDTTPSTNNGENLVNADEHIAESTEYDYETRPSPEAVIPADERQAHFKDRISGEFFAPVMVTMPAGSFMMGDGHKLGDDNENPQRKVHLRSFAISATEITFEDYAVYAEQANKTLPNDEGWGQGKRPVINISWQDAQAYARWLSLQTGQPYRLPTEAEWEYAARATSQHPFPWGRRLQTGNAVCDNCGSEWDGKSSAQVASQMPNRWGLYDMSGNVNEWVQDCYKPSIQATVENGSAFTEPNCSHKVVKGGSWFDIDRLVRPAGRYRHPIGMKTYDLGFRIALDLPGV